MRVEPKERLQFVCHCRRDAGSRGGAGQRLLQIVAIKGTVPRRRAAVRACVAAAAWAEHLNLPSTTCGSRPRRAWQTRKEDCRPRLNRGNGEAMAELPAKRRLEDPAKKSVAQISKTRQLEKMKDLESRVASLSRARDVLLVKNRMTKQLLAVKARTLQQGNQVTAYLRLENAKLATALEDLKKLEGPPDAAELYRATSLLGPSFAVHDHLADVNALFADASDRFHGDRCEDI